MRILISGASGLVGQALIPVLQQAGHQVSVLTTRPNSVLFDASIKVYNWQPEKGVLDKNALDGCEAIISLAGAKIAQRWTDAAQKSILESRVLGTRVLIDAVKNLPSNQVSHFISASAIGIYPTSKSEHYTEQHTKIANSFTGLVVKNWEEEAEKMRPYVKNVSKIRIGLVLAKNGGALPSLAIPASFGLGAWFGSGKQWQSWIHINDLVRLFVFTLSNPGCYNGVAPNPVTQKELVKMLSKTYKTPQFLPGIPKVFMRIVLGDMASVVYDSIYASSSLAQKKGFTFSFPTLAVALSNLVPLRSKK